MLHEEGVVRAYLTNSIDLLDLQAGFSATDYNYIDGVSLGPMCANCEKDYPLDVWVPELKAGQGISECKDCKGPIKPRVNFLNLALNERVVKKFETISQDCDLIIALDMNAYVAPFCLPIDLATVPMVCISEQNPIGSGYDFCDP